MTVTIDFHDRSREVVSYTDWPDDTTQSNTYRYKVAANGSLFVYVWQHVVKRGKITSAEAQLLIVYSPAAWFSVHGDPFTR
ncbi:hypothetical protein F9278_39870 [Streptomyces phaeolivaceus]|uniref:Uncharacterized protein n=1 Tax=Streptomyces phaeolivaceus TaxID=2653200 RepID=A0A5P8KDW2_9ACTN|nr:hypothetical protein [Streptomyces phaeolivaceus]QFR01322.1 hypothetical protein F9278_39870 [Streptomyces phaeolivaceus]